MALFSPKVNADVGYDGMKRRDTKIPAIVIIAIGLLGCSCRTQDWGEFHADSPCDLINLLADTTGFYNPPAAVLAHEKLLSMGTAAFPALVGRVEDGRPACRCFQEQTTSRTTVGDVCFGIIAIQVERYSRLGKVYPGCLTKRDVANWWHKRESLTLRELQIESLEWTIRVLQTDEAYRDLREEQVGAEALSKMKESLATLKQTSSPTEVPVDSARPLADPQH